jgi:hypothetical protein
MSVLHSSLLHNIHIWLFLFLPTCALPFDKLSEHSQEVFAVSLLWRLLASPKVVQLLATAALQTFLAAVWTKAVHNVLVSLFCAAHCFLVQKELQVCSTHLGWFKHD